MLRYYITNRLACGGEVGLLRNVERLGSQIDFLQIRERDLEGRELARLVRSVMRAADPSVRVLVNDRADVALVCGAHGVHLRGNSISAETIRSIAPESFLVSVACHYLEEVRRASAEKADLILVAPVFATPGKGPALGIEGLSEAVRASHSPVLALGGLTKERIAQCESAGAAGIAGIRLFQEEN